MSKKGINGGAKWIQALGILALVLILLTDAFFVDFMPPREAYWGIIAVVVGASPEDISKGIVSWLRRK